MLNFLSSLNAKFDQVRGKLLEKKPIPSTREVYSTTQRVESGLMVMMTKENPAKEGSTLNSETTLISNQWNFCKKKDYKDKLWYDFALIINQWNFYKKNYDKDRL